MHPENYTLTWHTYSDHLSDMMKELMMNDDFSDVILSLRIRNTSEHTGSFLVLVAQFSKNFLNLNKV